jgi:hypothetical protein
MLDKLNPFAPVLNRASKVIDDLVEDKDLRNKLKSELDKETAKIDLEELKQASNILQAEVNTGGVSATWRPHLMYLFMFIIGFNAVIVPICAAFGVNMPVADTLSALPSAMWQLLTICVGGYIGGRSVEKIAKSINFTAK